MSKISSALVTGATGFIGSHLVRRLVAQGVTTYCLVRRDMATAKLPQKLSGAQLVVAPSHHHEDIRTALSSFSAECVFHLASAGVIPGKESPDKIIDINVNLMTQLLLATADWPLSHFVYTGSCSEYGPSPSGRLKEDAPLMPDSVYGASKAAAYLCGRSLAVRLDVPMTNLRLFGVYGPGESPNRLIPHLFDKLTRRESVELTGGEQMRDVLYIDDVIDALCAATQLSSVRPGEVYNICSGEGVRVRDIVETVREQLKASSTQLRWGALPYRNEPMIVIGDGQKFSSAAGWTPKVSLQKGISKSIAARRAACRYRRFAA